MYKSTSMRVLAFFLALVMSFSAVQPAAAFAVETEPVAAETEAVEETTAAETEEIETSETATEAAEETTAPAVETEPSEAVTVPETEATEETAPATEAAEEETTPATEETVAEEETDDAAAEEAEGEVTNYADFLKYLKELEVYAEAYAATSSKYKDANLLVVNFIRTGVERYLSTYWSGLAGTEITVFTEYVKAQDAANGTNAMNLRNIVIDDFVLPNGNQTDFGHMFGTMNILYYSASTDSHDISGWAGDICDLLLYSRDHGDVPDGTVDEMAAFILEKCFGVDADDAFGWDDFYGDMDAFYLVKVWKGSDKLLSSVMEEYYTETLNDSDRSAFFLNNRFKGVTTREGVRTAVYEAYTNNTAIEILEADDERNLTDVNPDLRQAACYAFADYVFTQAGDRLEGDTDDGEDSSEPTDPSEPDDSTEPTDPSEPEEIENIYYTDFSVTESFLAPGITQSIHYALSADDKQMVYYVATVDVTRDDVTIMANYNDADPSKGWAMQRVMNQAAALQAKHTNPEDTENYIENFNVVVATNADGYNMSTGEPGGLLVMGGKEWHPVDGDGFFAILKDGSAMIGTKEDYTTYKDQIQEAIGGFGATLVKDGEIAVNKSSSYYNTRASRTAIGITADGKVVMMVLDGRQEPFSCGGSMEEIAQIMYEAGCVHAINLDGGGSTTYASKPEGGDSLVLVNRPSDGYQRSVSTSWVAVSTAKTSNEFERANIYFDYDYLTIGSSVAATAIGVSASGNAAEIPEGAYWKLSTDAVGTITEDGVFTATENGEVEVQLVVGDSVVGRKTLHVVIPDNIFFEKESMNIIFDTPVELPVQVAYNGNPVAFNEGDVELMLDDDRAGWFEGMIFTADSKAGIRNVNAYAFLMYSDADVWGEMALAIYKDGEAVYNFDDITGGDRQLSWKRKVINATTQDNVTYSIEDPSEVMDITYVFGLDMKSIDIPEKLEGIIYMLGGADDSTAWDFLLMFAERVSVLTEVIVEAKFDPNLDVDYSELSFMNEYFELKSASLDEETNVLTIRCNWVDQTQAIDSTTANPICILSGIKATPKEGAAWDANEKLSIINSGKISYDIYARFSSLYTFSQKPENQEKYGLYPYSSNEVLYNGGPEQGGHFSSTYATFEDTFVLDKSLKQGWHTYDDQMFYYVDHVKLTGVQRVPSYEDPSVELFYNFGEDGACTGKATGIVDYEGGKYYCIMGVMKTGWQSMYDADGNPIDYFFDRKTGRAVDGEQYIDGYNYIFTDYILTRGDLVKDEKGTRYRWAGLWVFGKWFDVGEDTYHTAKYQTYVTTGYSHVVGPDLEYGWYLFDENGVFQKHYSGKYDVGEDTYLLINGKMIQEPGLVLLDDGYYYYFCSTGKAVKNRVYWPTKTNGLLPVGPYQFDELGRIVNPPVVEPEEPETPTDPTDPVDPETPTEPTEPTPVKDGLVKENGALYYYKDGVIQYCAGLILIDGDYYYIRSNGQAATGNYWVTNNNGLLPSGLYTFGADGKMVMPGTEEPDTPDEPEESKPVKDGIVEVNGILYYYKNDVIQYCAGLILLDGDYYYVRSNGQLAIGKYWITNHNDLLPAAMYEFGADGKMLNPPVEDTEEPDDGETETPETPAVKNGIVEVNGILYYYENDAIKYGAGIVQLTDDAGETFYIYVRSNGQLALGNYWPTTTNGLLPGNRCYNFGTDGRLYL